MILSDTIFALREAAARTAAPRPGRARARAAVRGRVVARKREGVRACVLVCLCACVLVCLCACVLVCL